MKVMNWFSMKKELEKRYNIDSILVSMIIPIIIFIIGLISNFGFLFNLRNDDISLFCRIIVIFIIWLIVAMLLHLLAYLIKEVLILHTQKANNQDIVDKMGNNFNDSTSFFIMNLIIILILSVILYLAMQSLKNIIELILIIFSFSLILLLIIFVIIIINLKKKNKLFNNIVYSIKRSWSLFVIYIVSFMFIAFLFYFNNRRNIDINFNNNGFIKINYDYGINEDEHFEFQIYNNSELVDSQKINKSDKLTFIRWHDSHNKNYISTRSIVNYFENISKELSPTNFYMPELENCYYINLSKYVNNNTNENKSDNNYLIVFIVASNKHKFIVSNQFNIISGNYNFAKDSMHISLWPSI